MTTGGKPINVLIKFVKDFFPRNLRKAMNDPIGKDINVATNMAVPETRNESRIIPHTSGSREKSNPKASNIPSINSFTTFYFSPILFPIKTFH